MCDTYSRDSRCVSPPAWALEPANFYESSGLCAQQLGLCKPAGAPEGGGGMAELSAPAMYDDESAIDFSQYIESMTAVPNLELCNDELFLDLFNTNFSMLLPQCLFLEPGINTAGKLSLFMFSTL
uniref:Uncharacterized protein n=1 Tax=Gouania willdenowi TaxID=441366 RepID=A0A8C5GBC9_GOUWI